MKPSQKLKEIENRHGIILDKDVWWLINRVKRLEAVVASIEPVTGYYKLHDDPVRDTVTIDMHLVKAVEDQMTKLNENCIQCENLKKLDRTQRALDKAKDAIRQYEDPKTGAYQKYATEILEEIDAIERGEK